MLWKQNKSNDTNDNLIYILELSKTSHFLNIIIDFHFKTTTKPVRQARVRKGEKNVIVCYLD